MLARLKTRGSIVGIIAVFLAGGIALALPALDSTGEEYREKEYRVSPTTGMEFVWIAELGIWVGKYEVTNGEYLKKKPRHNSGSYRGFSLNGDRQPVVRVSFRDAKKFADWLTENERGSLPRGYRYRLPSNEEWTVIALCGEDRLYPWGDSWPPTRGNYSDLAAMEKLNIPGIEGYLDGHVVTAEVELSGRNEWGLYGVGGNVWEACAATTSGDAFGAWRGGSWRHNREGLLRAAVHNVGVGTARYDDRGFRLVLANSQYSSAIDK